tara:strand:+ start:1701 stop:2063 length:363 start_codon:yes stop_codon:yes gene_type:complete
MTAKPVKQKTSNHEPTPEKRAMVSRYSMVGTTQEIIADIMNIDPKTLRKHYRQELDLSTAKAVAQIGGALYTKAMAGDNSAIIFFLKTRGGWRETDKAEDKDDSASLTDSISKLIDKLPN